MSAPSDRPRLSDRALPRRHFIDGVERIVLHDGTRGVVHILPPEAWRIAQHLDGTKSPDQVAELARGDGPPRLVETEIVIQKLAELGLIEQGPARERPLSGMYVETNQRAIERPFLQLPGFRLACDGHGECCVFFTTVGLSGSDAERARSIPRSQRSLLAHRPAHEDPWMPVTGASRNDCFAMNLVDGRCVELEEDRRCGLQRRGGVRAKPTGCRVHPFAFVDDGEVIRVSVGADCSCVFRSLDQLGPASDAVPFDDLSWVGAHVVRTLPDDLPLTARVNVARADLAGWTREVRHTHIVDPIGFLLAHAVAFRARARASDDHPDHADLEPHALLMRDLAGYAGVAAEVSRRADQWRSANDQARYIYGHVAPAAARTLAPGRVAELGQLTDYLEHERFYVRALLYGHLFSAPAADALVRMAARLVIARELFATERSEGPSRYHPIAMTELVNRTLSG